MSPIEENSERIEHLKEGLYSRAHPPKTGLQDTRPHSKPVMFSEVWDKVTEENPFKTTLEKQNPIMKKLFILALVFFVASLVLAGVFFLRGTNFVSSANIGIEVIGPVSAAAGDDVEFEVKILNENATPLESSELKVVFPPGTRNPDSIIEEYSRASYSLGKIEAGGEGVQKVKAVLFGEEQSKAIINFVFEYRVAGSNAIFEKSKDIEVIISRAPVRFQINGLDEVNSNQEIDLELEISSNSDSILSNVLVSADYPFGFEFISSVPSPTYDNFLWDLGDLPTGAKKKIKIKGVIRGENGEKRVVRFDVGAKNPRNPREVAPVYLSTFHEMQIAKPFVGVELSVNGSGGAKEISVPLGKTVKVDLLYVNNLSVPVRDAEIRVVLEGSVVDDTRVNVDRGFYRSDVDTVIWEKNTNSALSSIQPGDSGRLSFSMDLIGAAEALAKGVINPTVRILVYVKATRTESTSGSEELQVANVLLTAKSDASVLQRIVYSEGPISNTGPIPPKAEKETTYSIIWTVTNGTSDVRDAVVKADLPTYVTWADNISPSTEDVSFNRSDGTVTWKLGKVESGAGYGKPPRRLVFQVKFLPSLSQVGAAPIIVHEALLTATDGRTGDSLTSVNNAVTTRISTDPEYKIGDERVSP